MTQNNDRDERSSHCCCDDATRSVPPVCWKIWTKTFDAIETKAPLWQSHNLWLMFCNLLLQFFFSVCFAVDSPEYNYCASSLGSLNLSCHQDYVIEKLLYFQVGYKTGTISPCSTVPVLSWLNDKWNKQCSMRTIAVHLSTKMYRWDHCFEKIVFQIIVGKLSGDIGEGELCRSCVVQWQWDHSRGLGMTHVPLLTHPPTHRIWSRSCSQHWPGKCGPAPTSSQGPGASRLPSDQGCFQTFSVFLDQCERERSCSMSVAFLNERLFQNCSASQKLDEHWIISAKHSCISGE